LKLSEKPIYDWEGGLLLGALADGAFSTELVRVFPVVIITPAIPAVAIPLAIYEFSFIKLSWSL
jgi:hypothetical protein